MSIFGDIGDFFSDVGDAIVDVAEFVAAPFVALSYLAQGAHGAKTPDAVQSYSKMQSGGIVAQSFVIGTREVPGSLVYFNYWGQDGKTPNAYESRVTALSDIPSTALLGLIVNDKACTYGTGTPDADLGYPIPEFDKDGQHYLWVKFYDGSQDAADPFLVSKFSADTARPYAATRKGIGRTYVVTTIRTNDQSLTSSSTIKYIVKGAKWYDPRKDTSAGGSGSHRFDNPSTWEYSENPQLIRYNIRRGVYYGKTSDVSGQWVFGLQGMSAVRVPFDNWVAAFNACDATVTNSQGEEEPAYRCGGEVSLTTEPGSLDESLMRACNGRSIEMGGIYKTITGVIGDPIKTYTDADFLITSPKTYNPYPGLSGTINGVTPHFPDPTQNWQIVDAPGRFDPTLELQDGRRQLISDINYDIVPFAEQVQRLSKSALEEDRRWRTHVVVWPHTEWQNEPGDSFLWTSAKNGYDSKQFRIEAIQLLPNRDLQATVREVDPADYDFNPNTDFIPVSAGTLLPKPIPAQPMVDWDAEGVAVDGADGRQRPAIRLNWSTAGVDDVDGVLFEVALADDGSDVYSGETAHSTAGFLTGTALLSANAIIGKTDYLVRGRYRPVSNRETSWSDWLPITTLDIRYSAEDLYDASITAIKFAEGIQPVQVVDDLGDAEAEEGYVAVLTTDGKLYRYHDGEWTPEVPTVDLVGTISAAQLGANIVDQTKVAVGLNFIKVVSSLPGSGTEGDTVFDSTDGKLYRYHSGDWTAVVDTSDLDGTISNAQIAANAIDLTKIASGLTLPQIVSSLPSVTTANNGQLAWLSTDGKLYRVVAGAWSKAVDGADLVANSITAGSISAGAIGTTELAASAVTAGKIASGTITAAQIAGATITGSNIAGTTITAANLAANTITAGQIAAGAIGAAQIAANAVTASKVFIGSTDNLVLDGNCQDASYWTNLGSHNTITSVYVGAVGYGTPYVVEFPTIGGSEANCATPMIACLPGDVFFVSLVVNISASGIVGGAEVIWYNASGSSIGSDFIGSSSTVGSVVTLSATCIAPTNTAFIQLLIYTTSTPVGYIVVGSPVIRRMYTGSLIVNGSITASNIAAGTITANELAANSVTSGKLAANSVTAGAIAAGAINATAIIANNIIVTGHIQAAQITQPVQGSAGNVTLTTTFATICSVTITTTGGLVQFDWSSWASWTGGGSSPEVDYQVLRGVSQVAPMSSGGGSSVPLYLNMSGSGWLDNPSAGTYTYALQGKMIGATVTAHNNSIRCVELLR